MHVPSEETAGCRPGRTLLKGHGFAAAVFLLLLVLASTWPALQGEPVFDDVHALAALQSQGLDDLPELLTLQGPNSLRYRPLRYVSLLIDREVGGGDARAFHLTNLVLHLGCGGLLGALLWRLGLGRRRAFFVAAIFLLHPLAQSAVVYISGRKDLLCGFFYLLALHSSLSARRRGGWIWLVVSLACGALAFFGKEMALSLPLAFLLLDRADGSRAAWWKLPAERPLFYGVWGVAGLAGVFEKIFLQPGTRIPLDRALDLVANLPLVLQTLGWHGRKLLWPFPQLADPAGLFPQMAGPAGLGAQWNSGGWLWTLVGIALLFGIAHLLRRDRAAGLALSFFLLALIPVLNLVQLNEPVAEHYLYMPLFGGAVLLLLLFERFRRSTPLLLAFLLVLSGVSHQRARVWASPQNFWESTLSVNPLSGRGWNNLGALQLEAGEFKAAEISLRRAVELPLSGALAWANLSGCQLELDRAEDALAVAEAGLRDWPGHEVLLQMKARVLATLALDAQSAGRLRESLELFRRSLELDDQRPSVWTNYGQSLLLLGEWDAALQVLGKATAFASASAQAWQNHAVALYRVGDRVAAQNSLREAVARGAKPPASLIEAIDAGTADQD